MRKCLTAESQGSVSSAEDSFSDDSNCAKLTHKISQDMFQRQGALKKYPKDLGQIKERAHLHLLIFFTREYSLAILPWAGNIHRMLSSYKALQMLTESQKHNFGFEEAYRFVGLSSPIEFQVDFNIA